MFIKTQKTPNPNTLKFIPGIVILKGSPKEYHTIDNCKDSDIAKQLLKIRGVTLVFFGKDFISVSKDSETGWNEIKTFILSNLVDYIISGKAFVKTIRENDKSVIPNTKTKEKIINLLDTKIRPAVAQDGGDIVYNKFENGVLFLELHGACRGCPSSTITLKQGVENMLKHYIPEIQSVESV